MPLLTPSIFFVTRHHRHQLAPGVRPRLPDDQQEQPGARRSQTVVYLFYERGFVEHNGGYAAAIAFVLMVVILVFTVIQFRMQRRWVHYG